MFDELLSGLSSFIDAFGRLLPLDVWGPRLGIVIFIAIVIRLIFAPVRDLFRK